MQLRYSFSLAFGAILATQPFGKFAAANGSDGIPSTIYCYYSYLSGAKRLYNYIQVTSSGSSFVQQMGLFDGAGWQKVAQDEVTTDNQLTANGYVYVLGEERQAENLVRYCENHLTTQVGNYYPRFESARIAGAQFYSGSTGWLISSAMSYISRSGYPVVFRDVEASFGSLPNSLVRVDAVYNAKKTESVIADLTVSVIDTNKRSKPRLRRVSIEDLNPYDIFKHLVTEGIASEVATRVGQIAETRVNRLFYEDPRLVLRHADDNRMATDVNLYIGTRQPEVMKNFLTRMGLDLDSMFKIHGSVDWALAIVRRRFEHTLAYTLSKSVAAMVALGTKMATQRLLLEMAGFTEEQIQRRLHTETARLAAEQDKLDRNLVATFKDIAKSEGEAIVDCDSMFARELQKDLLHAPSVSFKEAQTIELAIHDEIEVDWRADLAAELRGFGGIKRIRTQRLNGYRHVTKDRIAKITAGDVVAAKMAAVKVKLHAELHKFIREGVQSGIVTMSRRTAQSVQGGTIAVTAALTPLIGPNALLVTGGISVADYVSSRLTERSFLDALADHAGQRLGRTAADRLDKQDLPLPSFVQVRERDIELLARGDIDLDFDALLIGGQDDEFAMQADNPQAPTLGNYLKQQASMVHAYATGGWQAVASGPVKTFKRAMDAACFLGGHARAWANWLSGVEKSEVVEDDEEREYDLDDSGYFTANDSDEEDFL